MNKWLCQFWGLNVFVKAEWNFIGIKGKRGAGRGERLGGISLIPESKQDAGSYGV